MRSTILLLLALSACATTPASSPFQDRVLATIPEGTDLIATAFTPDGLEVAYVARTGDVCRAVRGTWKSPPLDAM